MKHLPQIVPVYTSLNYNHNSVLYIAVADVITYICFDTERI